MFKTIFDEGTGKPTVSPTYWKRAPALFPDRTFVSDATGRLSYGDVDRLAARVALRLLDLGLKPRDIVLLQFPNIREFIIVFFALQKIGVIPVMCLPQHRGRELTYFAQLTGAKAYFFPQRFRNFDYVSMAKEIQATTPTLQYLLATGDGTESGVSYLGPWIEEEPRVTMWRAYWRPIGPILSRWRSCCCRGERRAFRN